MSRQRQRRPRAPSAGDIELAASFLEADAGACVLPHDRRRAAALLRVARWLYAQRPKAADDWPRCEICGEPAAPGDSVCERPACDEASRRELEGTRR